MSSICFKEFYYKLTRNILSFDKYLLSLYSVCWGLGTQTDHFYVQRDIEA